MSPETQEKVKSMFCEVDKANVVVDDVYKNHIASSKPAYMHKSAMENLEDSVNSTAEALGEGRVEPSAVEFYRRKLSREKLRLDAIKDQTPKYTPVEMGEISTARKCLDVKISDALFTKSDMEKGLVDPAKEADRMTEPCIEVDRKLAAMCNVKLTNGKCSRSEAEIIRKMALWHESNGEDPAFTEELRKDKGGHAKKADTISMSSIPRENYDRAFGNKSTGFEVLEKKIADLEVRLSEKETENKKKVESVIWKCEEEGCDFVGTNKNKGIHKALHVRKANIAAKKEEE